MSLLLRFDPARQVLASLGDPPHGLVAVLERDDGAMGFVVDPGWQPERAEPGCHVRPAEAIDGVTPVGVAELVAGCADGRARRALWAACAMVVHRATVDLAETRSTDLRPLVGAVELWSAVADALEADGE